MNNDFNQNGARGHIAEYIKQYVHKNQINYRDLAFKANISPTKISAYINMTTTPSLENLLKICKAMGASLNDVTGINSNYQYDQFLDSLDQTIASFEKKKEKDMNEQK